MGRQVTEIKDTADHILIMFDLIIVLDQIEST